MNAKTLVRTCVGIALGLASCMVAAADGDLDLAFGADGHLYVSSDSARGGVLGVLKFDGATGAFIGTFVPGGSGGFANAVDIEFGPDGHLYVSDFNVDAVLKYDGTTGASLGQFVTASSGGLSGVLLIAFHSATPLPVPSFCSAPLVAIPG